MAVDRTNELLEYFESFAAESKTHSDVGPSGLRNRHRRDRFAVEDLKSPSIISQTNHPEASAECHSPLHSFAAEASRIYSNIVEAERILSVCRSTSAPLDAPFQQILDLCLMRISSLQKLSEKLSSDRKANQGWLSVFRGTAISQLDQHEAAIVWFLNHRLSNLSRKAEAYREQRANSEKETLRVKETQKFALATARPLVDKAPAVPSVPVISNAYLSEEFGVSPEQMQALAMENDSLLQEYSEMQEQIDTTHASIHEIARLQTTLQDQLVYQSTQIDRLFDEANTTVDTVRKANTHLNQTAKRQSGSMTFFLWFMCIATLFVLLLHIISD